MPGVDESSIIQIDPDTTFASHLGLLINCYEGSYFDSSLAVKTFKTRFLGELAVTIDLTTINLSPIIDHTLLGTTILIHAATSITTMSLLNLINSTFVLTTYYLVGVKYLYSKISRGRPTKHLDALQSTVATMLNYSSAKIRAIYFRGAYPPQIGNNWGNGVREEIRNSNCTELDHFSFGILGSFSGA